MPNLAQKKKQTLVNFVATDGSADQHIFEVHTACVIIIR
jgi:hypothetical protein